MLVSFLRFLSFFMLEHVVYESWPVSVVLVWKSKENFEQSFLLACPRLSSDHQAVQ